MKRYELLIITGDHLNPITQFAEDFETDSGYYEFIYNEETIACYPIDRTIIRSIETIEEEEFE